MAWVVAEAVALAAGLVVSFLPVDEVAVDCLATADVDAAVAFPATYCDAIFEAVVWAAVYYGTLELVLAAEAEAELALGAVVIEDYWAPAVTEGLTEAPAPVFDAVEDAAFGAVYIEVEEAPVAGFVAAYCNYVDLAGAPVFEVDGYWEAAVGF